MGWEELVIPAIVGLTAFGVSFLHRVSIAEAIKEIGSVWRSRDEAMQKSIYSVLTIEANKNHGVEVEGAPPEIESQLVMKYNDVSNKYNEILELITASHQTVAQLMAEFVSFKAEMNEFVKDAAFRMERLEHYNLSDGQTEAYKKED